MGPPKLTLFLAGADADAAEAELTGILVFYPRFLLFLTSKQSNKQSYTKDIYSTSLNLQDSDKLREMARKVNLAETSLKQARLVPIEFCWVLCSTLFQSGPRITH